MSKKIDKEMLKNPDVFVSTSDKIFEFIERHFVSFISLAGVVVVAALVYVGYNYFNASREASAAAALYPAEEQLRKVEEDAQTKKAAVKDKPAVAEDYAKDYAPLVEKVKTQIQAYAERKASLISALNLADFLLQQKQYGEALAVLSLAKYQPSIDEDLFGFLMMHRGVALLENNQTAPAIEAYQKVLNAPKLKVFYPEALLKLGLSYEQSGDTAKARETYERIGRDFPETDASATAQQYIRLLELKSEKRG